MCGKSGSLTAAKVESAAFQLCQACLKYGTIKKKPQYSYSPRQSQVSTPEFRVVDNYPSLIRKARESRSLNQEQFASFLQERASVVQKWESGSLKPQLAVARQLEKKLDISLVEKDERAAVDLSSKKSDEMTLGDFIKVRKRK